MNGRLLALIGAIALFVCLWRSPEVTPPAKTPMQVAHVEVQQPATRLDVAAPLAPALSDPPTAIVEEPRWLGEPLLTQLPAELFPGLYRVVSTDGAVGEVLVPGTLLGASPQELIRFPQGDVTWYFIRQKEGVVAAKPAEVAAVREVPLPPPLPRLTPEVVTEPADLEVLPLPELNSKERDIAEAQLRQWMKAMSVQVKEWFLHRWLGRSRMIETPLTPRPRFLQFASYQRSAADPRDVLSPRRIEAVGFDHPVKPSCACPVLPCP